MEQVETILLAEDSSDDVLILKRVLRQARISHRLIVVTDGQQAIDYLAGNSPYADRQAYPLPGLVLLDLKMPRKSGLEVLAWKDQEKFNPTIPVVVLSSSAEQRDIDQAMRLGAWAYLFKPPTLESILQVLDSLSSFGSNSGCVAKSELNVPSGA